MHRDTHCTFNYITIGSRKIGKFISPFHQSTVSTFFNFVSLFPLSLQMSNKITAVLTHFSASFMNYLHWLPSACLASHTHTRTYTHTHKLFSQIFLKIESKLFPSTVSLWAVHLTAALLSFFKAEVWTAAVKFRLRKRGKQKVWLAIIQNVKVAG